MKHFSRQLRLVLAGPPAITQTQLCSKARLVKSKLCRVLQDVIACDRPTLSAILKAVPDKKSKRDLLNAYLQDVATPDCLALLRQNGDAWAGLQLDTLSPKGQK